MNDVVPFPAGPDRRRFLTAGLGVAGGAALWAVGAGGTAVAAPDLPRNSQWRAAGSANGWPVVDEPKAQRIEGSDVSVAVRDGEAATVLLYVARRFHYEIDTLRAGDITGHRTSRTIQQPYESNYLSGTAIAIRPAGHPVGAENGFFPNELVIVRDILAECEGVVRWGGDERTPKESHFQIDVRPGDARLKAVAAKIGGWSADPGKGAGTVDAFEPGRRRVAEGLKRRQRSA
ncbi:hypothetical protein [Streptomyces sp. NBC_00151]|uniref:hypothetical protein n=1 Tax=Streptomyces sp. NBC_00151 TaxID=2975669 RepID=UPI002DDA8ADE|nr:hypothetical protein [Streptomyces sp. NBC_00151]WRZ39674.1 hypothetical protein OG915_17470 [Streptomyces sp. NBC_00151]